jgi:hypothetical protein
MLRVPPAGLACGDHVLGHGAEGVGRRLGAIRGGAMPGLGAVLDRIQALSQEPVRLGGGGAGCRERNASRRLSHRAEAHLAGLAREREAEQPGLGVRGADLQVQSAAVADADGARRAAGMPRR